ncbi:MAG TPA: DUF2508 family protein [Firmicutes bacterium]|nr:hypothetical protein [Bacillota bacterium]HHV56638.1 DUF2508 family protein [Bacillota bacterium]
MQSTPEVLPPNPVQTVREAYRDWRQAQCYFKEVTDPTLVDFAIFWERAARLRYQYLLRCLKREGYALSRSELIRLAVH